MLVKFRNLAVKKCVYTYFEVILSQLHILVSGQRPYTGRTAILSLFAYFSLLLSLFATVNSFKPVLSL